MLSAQLGQLMTMERALEITLGYLLTEGQLTGELTQDDGTGPKCTKMMLLFVRNRASPFTTA